MKNTDIEGKFLQMYEQYSDAIFRYCAFRVFNREKAQDIVQDVFTKTWRYMRDGGEIKYPQAFLYRTALNAIIDLSKKKEDVSLEILQEKGFDPGTDDRTALENFLAGKEAFKKLDLLDDKYSQVVIMRFVNDLSPKEISEITGESENLISVRLHRALKQLKEIIEK